MQPQPYLAVLLDVALCSLEHFTLLDSLLLLLSAADGSGFGLGQVDRLTLLQHGLWHKPAQPHHKDHSAQNAGHAVVGPDHARNSNKMGSAVGAPAKRGRMRENHHTRNCGGQRSRRPRESSHERAKTTKGRQRHGMDARTGWVCPPCFQICAQGRSRDSREKEREIAP